MELSFNQASSLWTQSVSFLIYCMKLVIILSTTAFVLIGCSTASSHTMEVMWGSHPVSPFPADMLSQVPFAVSPHTSSVRKPCWCRKETQHRLTRSAVSPAALWQKKKLCCHVPVPEMTCERASLADSDSSSFSSKSVFCATQWNSCQQLMNTS